MSEEIMEQELSEENEGIGSNIFAMSLLFDRKVKLPDEAEAKAAADRFLGMNEIFTRGGKNIGIACYDHTVKTEKGDVPVLLMMSACYKETGELISEFDRQQLWDCPDHERILDECRYCITAVDTLAGALPPKERAELETAWLLTLLDLFPECWAVYFANSAKLMETDKLRQMFTDPDKDIFPYLAVNVRFFNVTGAGTEGDMVVDTLGMEILGLPDLQYHFHGAEVGTVVGHAYNMACYLLYYDCPIKDGDTVDGLDAEGHISGDIQWKCSYENALVTPPREVIDIEMGELASGERG